MFQWVAVAAGDWETHLGGFFGKMRLPMGGRVTHLFRACGVVNHEVLSSSFSMGCVDGSRFCDASGGTFLQDASQDGGQGAGDENSISVGWRPAANTAAKAAPNGEALAVRGAKGLCIGSC